MRLFSNYGPKLNLSKLGLVALVFTGLVAGSASAQKAPPPDHPLIEKNFKVPDFSAGSARLKVEIENIAARHEQLKRRQKNREADRNARTDLDEKLDSIFDDRRDRTDDPAAFARIHSHELAVARANYKLEAWEVLGAHYLRKNTLDKAKAVYFRIQSKTSQKQRKAEAIGKMGEAFFAEGDLKTALNLYYLSLTINPTRQARRRYDSLAEQTDLRIKDVAIDVERPIPAACVVFTQELAPDLKAEDFVAIEPAGDVDIAAQGNRICIRGLKHGTSYKVTIRAGLPSLPGPKLHTTQTRSFTVGDMSQRIVFASNAYVLPRSSDDTIPVKTVNLEELSLALYRINDRNLLTAALNGTLNGAPWRGQVNQIKGTAGEQIWIGTMKVPEASKATRNREQISNIPLSDMLEKNEPGIYLLTAEKKIKDKENRRRRNDLASQWVLVSDLGLTTFLGKKGLDIIIRSLDSTRGVSGVELTLVARNNKLLATARTDSSGMAHFAPGLVRGEGGNAAAMVMAERRGDFNYIKLFGAALDLSDHGVAGRTLATEMDAFVYTDRGVYRPGGTVQLSALMRDRDAKAVGGTPLTFVITRPDRTEIERQTVTGDEFGGYHISVPISATARPGRWSVRALLDKETAPVGTASFQVEDFVPQRIKAQLSTTTKIARPGDQVAVTLQGNFLYGPPATGLKGEADVTIMRDLRPFADYKDYRFGLAEEKFYQDKVSAHEFVTNEAGQAEFNISFAKVPDTSWLLKAIVKASLFDVSGRPVYDDLSFPVRTRDVELGMRRNRDASFAENEAAGFDIVAVDPQGKPIKNQTIGYEWVREVYDWSWYRQGSQWRTRSTRFDEVIEVGEAKTDADGTLHLTRVMTGGRYRLEVRDLGGSAVSSQQFYAGWWSASSAPNVPDKLELTLENDTLETGETLKAFIKAPFAGTALITVLGDGLLYTDTVNLPLEGTEVSLRAERAWGPGAYLAVTALRPKTNVPSKLPARAMALKWFSIDKASRTARVEIEVPDSVVPRQTVTLPVALTDFKGKAGPMRLSIAAVDEGILQLTDFATPNPAGYYFAQRRLGVQIRDIYGRLIKPEEGARGQVRTGGDVDEIALTGSRMRKEAAEDNAAGTKTRTVKTVALYQRDVMLDKNGKGQITLDLPDFNGRLRLMVVAYGATRVGQGEAGLIVRDPVVADLLLPRFLAPGDQAEASLSLHNLSGKDQVVNVAIETSKGLKVRHGANASYRLANEERRDITIPIHAKSLGDASAKLTVSGDGMATINRDWDIAVRPAQAFVTNRSVDILQPNTGITLTSGLFAGLLEGTGRAGITLAARPEFDVPGLLDDLSRYPYGCTEQLVSRAMPLLYFGEVAEKWNKEAYSSKKASEHQDGLAIPRAIDHAILGVLDHQRYDGSLAVWRPNGDRHMWVTAYAMDFLTRAQEEGHDVPAAAFKHGTEWLKTYIARPRKGEGYAQAYAYYVLARLGQVKTSEVRYYAETQSDTIRTRLGLAHLGAALAVLGEQALSEKLFVRAIDHRRPDLPYIRDYGSDRRDAAAILALLAEATPGSERLLMLGEALEEEYEGERWLSTQEQAWLLRATHALTSAPGAQVVVKVGDKSFGPQGEPVRLALTPAQVASGLAIANTNDAPVRLVRSVRGVPVAPLPAVQNGFEIRRSYYTVSGRPVDLADVHQNDLIVVLISGKSYGKGREETLVVDMLPAGLEIENSALGNEGDARRFKFLPRLSRTEYTAARDDRYVAAINLRGGSKFATAYIARAVTPGTYVHPAIFIEDMYRPKHHGRGALGSLTVKK